MSESKYIKRIKKGDNFDYYTNNNKKINDKHTLEKIKKIYIAPAYTNVKIYLNNNLLATGIDAAGRKQYVYSDNMKKKRELKKYKKLLKIIEHIDKLKRRINEDLKETKFTRNKLIALVLRIMDLCNFRSGNKKYEKKYGSFGITTIHKKHVSFKNNSLEIEFIGKKGVNNHCAINNKEIQDIVKKIYKLSTKDNPYLFSIDNGEEEININVNDVNDYLKAFDVTTKDLRTYNANVIFLKNFKNELKALDKNYYKKTELQQLKLRKKVIKEALLKTATSLHHTPTICKSSYIYKTIIEKLQNDEEIFDKIKKNNNLDEKSTLYKFLKKDY